MSKTVEFLFDFVSPASYIAWHVLPRIAEAAGAQLTYVPVFLGGIMQATGNRPPGQVAAKGAWMSADLTRWAGRYGLAFKRNSVHPQNTMTAMRGALVLLGDPAFRAYGDALMQALHVEDREIQDPAVFGALLADLGLDPEAFLQRTSDPAIKAGLKENTERAVTRGVFGAPTFLVGETLHFGQDRLDMVAEDLGITLDQALAR